MTTTRYEQVTEVAIASADKHFDNHANCQRSALNIAAGYADFLQCPRDRVDFVFLDGDLNRTQKTEPLGNDPSGGDVPLAFSKDGFWNFCFRIKYEKPIARWAYEFIRLGLKVCDKTITVQGDQEFEIDLGTSSSISEFFELLFRSSLQLWSSPLPFLLSKHIGFV